MSEASQYKKKIPFSMSLLLVTCVRPSDGTANPSENLFNELLMQNDLSFLGAISFLQNTVLRDWE